MRQAVCERGVGTGRKPARKRVNAHGQSALQRLRSAYFAQAAESAARYGVSFERVVMHLWQARRLDPRFSLRHVAHVDDLVHAVACVDGDGLAWSDLMERYERALIRRSRGGPGEIDAIIAVRRMLADLRRCHSEMERSAFPSLQHYTGAQELRTWLAQRAAAAAVLTNPASRQSAQRRWDAGCLGPSVIETGT
jgi:hypothetical protein